MPSEEILKKEINKIESKKPGENQDIEKESPDLDLEKTLDKITEKIEEAAKTKETQDNQVTTGEDDLARATVSNTSSDEIREKKIEEFLSEGLDDFYLKMDGNRQQVFKQTGEQTANEINLMLTKTKVKINKIITLIKKWLSLIPGVSTVFLEKEAKIRADKIIKLNK